MSYPLSLAVRFMEYGWRVTVEEGVTCMKIVKLEAIIARVAYKRVESSSLINRGGITDVIVKMTPTMAWSAGANAPGRPTRQASKAPCQAMAPLVIGRSIWDKEAIQRDLAIYAVWAFQPMTGNFAYAGIDMALWDLCGKECGQPLYRMLGGAMRDAVDYFYYMEWGTPEEHRAQAKDGVRRGYQAYYIKVGVDERREEEMLEALARHDRTARQDQDRRQPGLDDAASSAASQALASRGSISISSRRRCGSIRSRTCSTCGGWSTCPSASMRACGARPMPTG